MKADIIIPTRNRGAMVQATLTSICASTFGDFTIRVIDQSENDLTERAVREMQDTDARIWYMRSTTRGISPSRNLGVAAGTAPVFFFTDDDCVVAPDWLEQMMHEFEDAQTIGVFGRVLPAEPEEHMPDDGPPVSDAIKLALKDVPQRQVFQNNRYNLGFGHGANMGFRREAWQALGGVDECIGTGGPLGAFEERDLGYRMLARGWRIVYTPDAIVYHRHWRTWRGVKRAYRDYAIGAGAAVGKFMRCGDWGAWRVLWDWMVDQGLRQILSGAFKWRSWQKMYVGAQQLVYPWVGIFNGSRTAIDRARILYVKA